MYVQLDIKGSFVRDVLQGSREKILQELELTATVCCATAREEGSVTPKLVKKSIIERL